MAVRIWNSAASTDMNNGANYTGAGALLPADDLVFNNTSIVNSSATADLNIFTISIGANYTGTWSFLGHSIICGGAAGFHDTLSTATHTYGDNLTLNANNSQFHIHANTSTLTSSSLNVIINDTAGATIYTSRNNVTLRSLTVSLNSICTINGTGTNFTFLSNSTPLTTGANSTLTINNIPAYFSRTTNGDAYSFGANTTFNGNLNGIVYFTSGANAILITLPALTYSGSSSIRLYVENFTNVIFQPTGAINTGSAMLCCYANSNSSLTWDNATNNQPITCGTLAFGSNSATGSSTFNYGSATYTINIFSGNSYANGTSSDNLQTSQFICNGNFSFGNNHSITPGTSLITITNTSTITSNSGSFYNLTINTPGNTVQLADNLTLAAGSLLSVTSGIFTSNNYNITSASISFGGTNALNLGTSIISTSSSLTISTSGTRSTSNSTIICTGATCALNLCNGANTTISKLSTCVAGQTITWTSSSFVLTIRFAVNNFWGGTSSSKVIWTSSVPGSHYHIYAPACSIAHNLRIRDCHNSGFAINASDSTCVNNGNNFGWYFSPIEPQPFIYTPLPKRLFVGCKDISGTDDFYLFSTLADKIDWRQAYYRSAEATEVIANTNMQLHQFNNIIIIQLIFASTPDWSYISFDRGFSWSLLNTLPAANPLYGGINENSIFASTISTLYKSINKTVSWSTVGLYPGAIGRPFKILFYPTNTICVGHDSGFIRSTTGGVTGSWSIIATGMAAPEKFLAIGNTILAFGSHGETVISTDQGATWAVASASPNPAKWFRDADFSDEQQNILIMILDEEIYLSYNFAISWIHTGTASFILNSIAQSYGQHLLAVNNSGYLATAHCFGEAIDEIPFDVGNTNILPFAIRKVSPHTEPSKAPITVSLKSKSSITTKHTSSSILKEIT